LFLTLNQPERALPWIDRAERLVGPEDRERPLVLRGQAYLEQGRLAEARKTLERAATIGPANGWSSYFLGKVAEAAGDPKGALAHYERAAALLPDDPGVRDALLAARAAAQGGRR
jgi:tetratricopeptide (TPR) repeat protein